MPRTLWIQGLIGESPSQEGGAIQSDGHLDQNQGKLAFVLKNPLNLQHDFTTLSGDISRGVVMNWKTTVRAAYGIYYTEGLANFQLFSSPGFGWPPFTNNANVVNDPSRLIPTTLDTQIFPAPLTAGILRELPFGKGKWLATEGVGATLLGGWQLSTLIQHRSGLPLSLSMPTSWPNRVCDGRLDNPTMDRYFDTGCFVAPATQSYDASLSRSSHLEHMRLDFRAESFSIFNIQNWNTPNTSLITPNYGKIFGKNNPRRFQFGLRVEF